MSMLDIKDKVISLKKAYALPPLVPITLCYRYNPENKQWFLENWKNKGGNWIPTYTVDEILDILPERTDKNNLMFLYKSDGFWNVGYYGEQKIVREKLLDALYQLLIWVYNTDQIDPKYIKAKL